MTAISSFFKVAKARGVSCKQMGVSKDASMMMWTEERAEKIRKRDGTFVTKSFVMHSGITEDVVASIAAEAGVSAEWSGEGFAVTVF